ncbi:hypothetical protein [Bradyrhizobium sp. Ash2021]|uniref:hypothetical protein n=1 Tax=Bradyrhizobium sp. Ash2021 TaxID=2954771 RepID=UPI002815811E|nr:hypothetical protein [Bradyrhizobium sp. Ash2021]WMT71343.1 hypothetical protein NL528_24940 [Bradyrhizobium sp. Ash2021]
MTNWDGHERIREMAAVGVADLWVDCETVFGNEPPAAAIFGRILDKLTNTAAVKGLSEADLVRELDCALVWARR